MVLMVVSFFVFIVGWEKGKKFDIIFFLVIESCFLNILVIEKGLFFNVFS